MVKHLLACAFSLVCLFVSAQEIFDMPYATGTYLTGINDSGEICGYYTKATGNTIAFWINKYGDTITLHGPNGNDTYVNATGINNKDQVVGNYGSASNVAAAQSFIYLPNPGRNSGGTYSLVSNWGGINTQASGITDDTCISGSYQVGGNDCGASWCKGNGTPISLRCSNGGTVYPTYGYDINTVNHNVCGFIIQGGMEQAFVYRSSIDAWDTFQVLGALKSKALGMNDGGWICGNYNNATRAFYAKKVWQQNLSNITSIKIPGAATIYPSHINNNNGIVGFYTDAQGVDHGFILATYDIGFRPSKNGYPWSNDNACWPSTYYSQFDYHFDPYLNDGVSSFPLNGNVTPPKVFNPGRNGSWPDAVRSCALSSSYTSTFLGLKYKMSAVNTWAAAATPNFSGFCFGMSYTAAMLFENFHEYSGMYPACAGYAGTLGHDMPNNNTTLAALAQTQAIEDVSREMNAIRHNRLRDTVFTTLQNVKQELRNSRGRPHHALGIKLQHESGGHCVFPYKIVPETDGNGVDSIFIYDPNYQGQDDLFILCDTKAGHRGDWYYTANNQHSQWGVSLNGTGIYRYAVDTFISRTFHFAALPVQNRNYGRSSSGFITAIYNSNSRVYMTDDNSAVAYMSIDSSVATDLIMPVDKSSGMDSIEATKVFVDGNLTTVNKITLADSIQSFLAIYDDSYLIRCDRISGNDTADNYSFSTGSLTYLNNTDSSKSIAYTVDIEPDSGSEYNYFITGLSVPGHNKVATTNYGTTGMIIQNFGPPTTYIITTDFVTHDSVMIFRDTIAIQGNTQHIIQPHDTTYSGIYIMVDTGMTGHIEDSIFIHQTVNGLNQISAPGITAWPVPSGNELFMTGPHGLIKYTIVDILGRSVAAGELDFGNGSIQKFDVHNLTPGIYTITGSGIQGKWNYVFVKL